MRLPRGLFYITYNGENFQIWQHYPSTKIKKNCLLTSAYTFKNNVNSTTDCFKIIFVVTLRKNITRSLRFQLLSWLVKWSAYAIVLIKYKFKRFKFIYFALQQYLIMFYFQYLIIIVICLQISFTVSMKHQVSYLFLVVYTYLLISVRYHSFKLNRITFLYLLSLPICIEICVVIKAVT